MSNKNEKLNSKVCFGVHTYALIRKKKKIIIIFFFFFFLQLEAVYINIYLELLLNSNLNKYLY